MNTQSKKQDKHPLSPFAKKKIKMTKEMETEKNEKHTHNAPES